MDPAIIQEINLLEQNKNKIDSTLIYDLMIHSIKGKYVCESQRKNFVISRSLPSEKIYQPHYVEPHAKEFIDCYANMLNHTKSQCKSQFNKIYECLLTNHGKNYDFPEKCVSDMEDFINC
jgi:hypothetical protein